MIFQACITKTDQTSNVFLVKLLTIHFKRRDTNIEKRLFCISLVIMLVHQYMSTKNIKGMKIQSKYLKDQQIAN